MSTNVVAIGVPPDISRIGAEMILAKDPLLSKNIAGILRLKDRSTADVGERLYRLFLTSLLCRRGGHIPLYDIAASGAPSTYIFIDKNKLSSPSSPVKSFSGDPVPVGLTFSSVDDLWLLSEDHPGVLICPSCDCVVPGIDAVIFQNGTLHLMQFSYYAPRHISFEALRFMWEVTRHTKYQPSRTRSWVFVVGCVGNLDERGFPNLLPRPGPRSSQEDVTLYGLLEGCIVTCALRLDGVGLRTPTVQRPDMIYEKWGVPYKLILPRSPEPAHIVSPVRSRRYEPDVNSRAELLRRQRHLAANLAFCRAMIHGAPEQRAMAIWRKGRMVLEADMATLGGSPSKFVTCFI